MGLKFTSIKRHYQFLSIILFLVPMLVSVTFSYIYLRRDTVKEHYLLQQNTLNFCLQELENNIFYSKISELSNMEIVRNELYRMYRVIDMSVKNIEVETQHLSSANHNVLEGRLDLHSTNGPQLLHINYGDPYAPQESTYLKNERNNQASNSNGVLVEPNNSEAISALGVDSMGNVVGSAERMIQNKLDMAHSRSNRLVHDHQGNNEGDEHGGNPRIPYSQHNTSLHSDALSEDEGETLNSDIIPSQFTPAPQEKPNSQESKLQDNMIDLHIRMNEINKEDIKDIGNNVVVAQDFLGDSIDHPDAQAFIAESELAHAPATNPAHSNTLSQTINSIEESEDALVDSAADSADDSNDLLDIFSDNEPSPLYQANSDTRPASDEDIITVHTANQLSAINKDSSHTAGIIKHPESYLSDSGAEPIFDFQPGSNIILGAPSLNAKERNILIRKLSHLQNLGFIAFSVNLVDPTKDIYIAADQRQLLTSLENNGRTLIQYIRNIAIPETGLFVVLNQEVAPPPTTSALTSAPTPIGQSSPKLNSHVITPSATYRNSFKLDSVEEEEEELSDDRSDLKQLQLAMGNQQVDTSAKGAYNNEDWSRKEQAMSAFSAEYQMQEDASKNDPYSLKTIGYDNGRSDSDYVYTSDTPSAKSSTPATEVEASPNKAEDTDPNRTLDPIENNNLNSFIGIVARLSSAPNQLVVIITNISKLKQQDQVLRKLIANSIDELVMSVGMTTPVSITLIDKDLNPLAGNLSQLELRRLINQNVLEITREQGMFQGYNQKWSHYITAGYFKPYDWFILLSSDDIKSNNSLWQYLLILFVSGFVMAAICASILRYHVKRDVSDLNTISNKIKHLSSLVHDPILLNRLCDNMPRRDDEIGRLGSYVRLMSKTIYQVLQEIIKSSGSRAAVQKSADTIFKVHQTIMPPALFIREYYHGRIMVHGHYVEQTSGDYYDVIELGKHKIALVIGSSNETGLTGATFSTLNVCLIRQIVRLTESIKLPLTKGMMEVNQNIFDNNPNAIFSSACIVIIDEEKGSVEYLNAGHTLPIIYRPSSGFEYIDVRNGPVLGIKSNLVFNSISFDLQDGDILLFYTDGLLDSTNIHGDPLGQDGFESLLHDAPLDKATNMVDHLVKKVSGYTKDCDRVKDYTITCYRYTKK